MSKRLVTVLCLAFLGLSLSFSFPAFAFPWSKPDPVELNSPLTEQQKFDIERVEKQEGDADTLIVPGTTGDGVRFGVDMGLETIVKVVIKALILFGILIECVVALFNSFMTPALVPGFIFKKKEMVIEGPVFFLVGLGLAVGAVICVSPLLVVAALGCVSLPGLIFWGWGVAGEPEPWWKLPLAVVGALIFCLAGILQAVAVVFLY